MSGIPTGFLLVIILKQERAAQQGACSYSKMLLHALCCVCVCLCVCAFTHAISSNCNLRRISPKEKTTGEIRNGYESFLK
jgi:hypothetical protein